MDDFVERSPVGFRDGFEGPVGGIAQRDEIRAEVAIGKGEHSLCLSLIANCGVSGANAEFDRGEHHVGRGLPEVVVQAIPMLGVFGFSADERDGGSRPGDVTGALPHLGEFL